MSGIVKIENIQELIIELRGQKTILDSDIAKLYGVETKRINEAVKNNPDKFPEGYLFDLAKDEWDALKSKFSTSNQRRQGKAAKRIYGKRSLHAGNHFKESACHTNDNSHH